MTNFSRKASHETAQRLFLLLSIPNEDLWESWDEDWDFLMDYGFIDLEEEDAIPTLTPKGEAAIAAAVKSCD